MTTSSPNKPNRGSFAAMYEASRQMSHDAAPRQLRLDQLEPNPDQPRNQFHQETLEELATSIKTYGLLQPLVVRPHPSGAPGRYQIVAGERRFHACKLAGVEAVPAIIKSLDDATVREVALIENLQRENISPLEEASVLKQILDETGLTHRELGDRIGKSKTYVEQRVRLLRYPAEIQQALAAAPEEGAAFTPGHAKAVVQLDDAERRQALIALIDAHGFSVRETERRVKQLLRLDEAAPGAERGEKLTRDVLRPAGLADAAFEQALTTRPARAVEPMAERTLDWRELGLYEAIARAQASGNFAIEASELQRLLKRELAALR